MSARIFATTPRALLNAMNREIRVMEQAPAVLAVTTDMPGETGEVAPWATS